MQRVWHVRGYKRRGVGEGNRTDTRNNNHKFFNQIIHRRL